MNFFEKRWNSNFTANHEPQEPSPFIEGHKNGGDVVNPDVLALFIPDTPDEKLSEDYRALRQFCEGFSLPQSESDPSVPIARRAWVHDSCSTTGQFRSHSESYSPLGLYRQLIIQRFNYGSLPNADQRLIYIPRLDPLYVLALAASTYQHQVNALRYALKWFLEHGTSIKILNTLGNGYPTFELHFHLSYYMVVVPATAVRHGCATNLDYLTDSLHVQKAQISFTISGTGEKKWAAYLFTNYDDESEENCEDVVYEDCGEFFRANLMANREQDAKKPIWNCREYYLLITGLRLSQAVRQWQRLIRKIEYGINKYIDGNPCLPFSSEETICIQKSEVLKRLLWTHKTLTALEKFEAPLAEAIRVWKGFSREGGEITYFSDLLSNGITSLSEAQIHQSFLKIEEKYEELDFALQRITSLVKRCQEYKAQATLLQSHLSNEIAEETGHTARRNGFATDLGVYLIHPVSMICSLFAISPEAITFPRNPKSFLVATVLVAVVLGLILRLGRRDWQSWYQDFSWKNVREALRRGPKLADCEKGLIIENLPEHHQSRALTDQTLVAEGLPIPLEPVYPARARANAFPSCVDMEDEGL